MEQPLQQGNVLAAAAAGLLLSLWDGLLLVVRMMRMRMTVMMGVRKIVMLKMNVVKMIDNRVSDVHEGALLLSILFLLKQLKSREER